ncbi:MAG: ComF family protein [Pedobacter sp.]|nr:MAG: ComF family protein [Pedobacter sp.]
MLSVKSLLSDAAHLFFPHNCMGCGNDVIAADNVLCLRCISNLPHTNFEKIAGNPIEKIFLGRINIHAASSQFYFSKGHLVQFLIHQLKYKSNVEAGEYMGAIMGKALLQSERFSNIDYLVPLPLYADKEFKRGYNQAKVICDGMSTAMQVPVHAKNVIRRYHTDTQTKKHRTERWENVEDSFKILQPEKLQGKHVLLVDDVITTGATLEACAQALAKIPAIRISLATLATASN